MTVLLYLILAFKVWMAMDAVWRGVSVSWLCIVIAVPFGEFAYFAKFKSAELNLARFDFRKKRISTHDLRYQYQDIPSIQNALLLAGRLYEEQAFDGAAQLYFKVTKRDATHVEAYYGSGLSRLALADYPQAVRSFARVVELDRSHDNYQTWLRLAEALELGGDPERAVQVLKRLVSTCPRLDHSVALSNMLWVAGHKTEARKSLEKALDDYRQAPLNIKRLFRHSAKQASQLLGQIPQTAN